MTADFINETQNSTNKDTGVANVNPEIGAAVADFVLPIEILELFEFLSSNDKIVFKSQQIDDPELQRSEKISIACDIYVKNRQTFLMRFGSYFKEYHLESFARFAISDGAPPLRSDESFEEIQFMLNDYQRKIHTRKKDVKNRRYTALQQLEEKGEYFSEQEMMKRAPELYQELVGQYLSEAEKQKRDSYDVRNTTFSGILLHTMERKEIEDVMREADIENRNKDGIIEEENDSQIKTLVPNVFEQKTNNVSEDIDNDAVDVPQSYRQQWGNFDNEQIACSTSQIKNQINCQYFTKKTISTAGPLKQKSNCATFITAGERDLLRQEFIGIMHEQFLAGNDTDFDYTQVDDNSQLDDLRQLNQDKEDAYFEESDNDNSEEHEEISEIKNNQEESEDELDTYMNHLSKHHSLQN